MGYPAQSATITTLKAVAATTRPTYTSTSRAHGEVYRRRHLQNVAAMLGGDTFALALSVLIAASIRHAWVGEAHHSILYWTHIPIWWAGAAMMRLLPGWGLGAAEELRRLTLLLVSVVATVLFLLFVTKTTVDVSRLTWVSALALSCVTVPLVRLQVKRLLVRAEAWGIPVAVYSAGSAGEEVVRLLQEEKGLGYQPVCAFQDVHGRFRSINGVPVLGSNDQVAVAAPVAVLVMPDLLRERTVQLLEGPLQSYRKVLVIPDMADVPSLWVRPRDLNGLLGLEITRNLLSPLSQWLKRAMDIVIVVLFAPLWLPLCAAIGLLIRLEDGGSPLFKQERIGKDGSRFHALKFRTMVPNAEAVLQKRLAQDEDLRREWETNFKLKVDPRVTRVGRVLRRFSLDELPQLFNVFLGEMSLVGPRPLPGYHHATLQSRVRNLREQVRPGITGFWQISGRSDIGTEGMEQWDSYYVRNWSPWLDAVALIRTARIVIRGSGAY